MERFKVELSERLGVEDAFCVVETEEGIHVAWELAPDGVILVFEWIPENKPKGGIYVFRNYREWLDEIPDWVYRAYTGKERRECDHDYQWNGYCGAYVCTKCGHHKGMSQCFCGWTEHGEKPVFDDVEDDYYL